MPPSEGGEVCCAWYHWLLYFEDKNFLWLPREGLLCLRRLCAAEARYIILCLKNIPSLTGYSFNTHPPVFFNNLLHVISRHSKIDCRYNFLYYLAFTYFILLWSEITTSATWSSESLIRGKHSAEHHRQGRWSMDSTTACMREGELALSWIFAVNNRLFSTPPDHKNRLFSESPTVYWRKRVALHVFSVW